MAKQSPDTVPDDDQPEEGVLRITDGIKALADKDPLPGSPLEEALRRVVKEAETSGKNYAAFGNAP